MNIGLILPKTFSEARPSSFLSLSRQQRNYEEVGRSCQVSTDAGQAAAQHAYESTINIACPRTAAAETRFHGSG